MSSVSSTEEQEEALWTKSGATLGLEADSCDSAQTSHFFLAGGMFLPNQPLEELEGVN